MYNDAIVSKIRGGCNSIPPSCPESSSELYISEVKLDKRVLFDWVSFTFDDLDGSYFSDPLASVGNTKRDRARRHRNDGIMNKLLSLLGCEDANWRNFELEKCSINGFKYSIVIGESILINIDGPKSSRGRPVTQLLMRGEG